MALWIATIGMAFLMVIENVDSSRLHSSKHSTNEVKDLLELLRIQYKLKPSSKSGDAFLWRDCGTSSSLLRFNSVSVTPSPLVFPGTMTAGFSVTVSKDLPGVVSVSMKAEKKVFSWWIEIPCIAGVGSCSFDNVCPMLAHQCPPVFLENGLPCQCPVKKGTYTLPNSPVEVEIGGVLSGEYRATINLQSGNTKIGCLYVETTIA